MANPKHTAADAYSYAARYVELCMPPPGTIGGDVICKAMRLIAAEFRERAAQHAPKPKTPKRATGRKKEGKTR